MNCHWNVWEFVHSIRLRCGYSFIPNWANKQKQNKKTKKKQKKNKKKSKKKTKQLWPKCMAIRPLNSWWIPIRLPCARRDSFHMLVLQGARFVCWKLESSIKVFPARLLGCIIPAGTCRGKWGEGGKGQSTLQMSRNITGMLGCLTLWFCQAPWHHYGGPLSLVAPCYSQGVTLQVTLQCHPFSWWSVCLWQDPPCVELTTPYPPSQLNTAELKRLHLICDSRMGRLWVKMNSFVMGE